MYIMEKYSNQVDLNCGAKTTDKIPLIPALDANGSVDNDMHSAFMYENNYGRDIFKYFKFKRDCHELSYNMISSTSARIRNECLDILPRCTKDDVKVLRNYLRCKDDVNLHELLTTMASDRFRPLNYYIKSDGQQSRSLDNIELLAVIIDFGMRPFSRYFSHLQKELKLLDGTGDLDGVVADNLIWDNYFCDFESQNKFADKSDYDGKKAVLIELPNGTKVHVDSCETELILKLASLDFTSFRESSNEDGRLTEN